MTSLKESQWQIGDLKFGRGSHIEIVAVEPVGYEVSAGDFQNPLSDTMRFRKDYLAPGVIQFQLAVMDNFVLPGMLDAPYQGPPLQSGHELLERFKEEWRADEIRTKYGWVKPLTRRVLGQGRMVFGRPRNIATALLKHRPGWYGVTCSYQTADTLVYSEEEHESQLISPTSVGVNGGTIARLDGAAPTWLKATIVGPIANPTIKLGPHTFTMNYTIPAGVGVEINSNPWERRVVSSTNLNLAAKMVGTSPYLEDLVFPKEANWNVALHGGSTTSATKLLVQWREAYHAL